MTLLLFTIFLKCKTCAIKLDILPGRIASLFSSTRSISQLINTVQNMRRSVPGSHSELWLAGNYSILLWIKPLNVTLAGEGVCVCVCGIHASFFSFFVSN